jgi:hypothetical protein
MVAPARQRGFRLAAAAHLVLVSFLALALLRDSSFFALAAQTLLIAGIVEGAVLIGWRLTQLPKSQSLEFLLVSPLHPKRVFRAEAIVGIARVVLVSLCGLPLLAILVLAGRIGLDDLVVLLAMPFLWAIVSGLGVTVWAYESPAVRRGCEFFGLFAVLLYLVVGVLAGENLVRWVAELPETARFWIMELYGWMHTYNPFAVLQFWSQTLRPVELAAQRILAVNLVGFAVAVAFAARGAARLRGHFHDRHYRPIVEKFRRDSSGPGDRPLSWWAVRRVMQYSGRVNIWLAGGFGIVYAAYTIAGVHWPPWMGRLIFQMVESFGGIPVVTAGLVVLAAVPASFQYGLWDSSVPDRCRRLELLLLTKLDGADYWAASAAAAWRRGRGYCTVALILWIAPLLGGKATLAAVLTAASAGVLVWCLYFALGFWSFARGRQANGFGSLLTLIVPLAAVLLARADLPQVAALVPPGSVWFLLRYGPTKMGLLAAILIGAAALALGMSVRRTCERDLRQWYDQNHGLRAAD